MKANQRRAMFAKLRANKNHLAAKQEQQRIKNMGFSNEKETIEYYENLIKNKNKQHKRELYKGIIMGLKASLELKESYKRKQNNGE